MRYWAAHPRARHRALRNAGRLRAGDGRVVRKYVRRTPRQMLRDEVFRSLDAADERALDTTVTIMITKSGRLRS